MRKDYARNIIIAQRRSTQRPTRLSVIVIVFVVAFIISTAGFWIYAHNGVKESITILASEMRSLITHKKPDAQPPKTPVAANAQTENPIRFDFYTELPKMQIKAPEMAVSKTPVKNLPRPRALAFIEHVKTKPPLAPPATQYIIQLGVFKDEISASQLRLSLLLSGIETDVVKLANHTYRVQKGPFATSNQAKYMQRRIDKKGIDSIVRPL